MTPCLTTSVSPLLTVQCYGYGSLQDHSLLFPDPDIEAPTGCVPALEVTEHSLYLSDFAHAIPLLKRPFTLSPFGEVAIIMQGPAPQSPTPRQDYSLPFQQRIVCSVFLCLSPCWTTYHLIAVIFYSYKIHQACFLQGICFIYFVY